MRSSWDRIPQSWPLLGGIDGRIQWLVATLDGFLRKNHWRDPCSQVRRGQCRMGVEDLIDSEEGIELKLDGNEANDEKIFGIEEEIAAAEKTRNGKKEVRLL
ncbi:unnamed protein product [Cochlearia groenlandica]